MIVWQSGCHIASNLSDLPAQPLSADGEAVLRTIGLCLTVGCNASGAVSVGLARDVVLSGLKRAGSSKSEETHKGSSDEGGLHCDVVCCLGYNRWIVVKDNILTDRY